MGGSQTKKFENSQIINIHIPKIDYFQGENITGEIYLKVVGNPLTFQDINISFKLLEGWFYETGGDDGGTVSEKNELILKSFKLNVREILDQYQNTITLNPGEYYFPFNYKLSNFISPTCEYYYILERAYLRYILSAELVSPYINSFQTNEKFQQVIIIKTPPKILKNPLIYNSSVRVKKWGLMNKGSTNITVSYLKNYSVFDEIVPITVIVDNRLGELDVILVKVLLIRNINFFNSKYGMRHNQVLYPIIINSNVTVKKYSTESFNFALNLRDTSLKKTNYKSVDDPYPENIDLNYFLPTTNGNLVRCDYCIKVSCHFECLVPYDCRPRVILPLFIGHPGKNNINQSILNNDFRNSR